MDETDERLFSNPNDSSRACKVGGLASKTRVMYNAGVVVEKMPQGRKEEAM